MATRHPMVPTPPFPLSDTAPVRSPENLPFLLHPAAASPAAVLLVHGFTASPWEMRALGNFLCAQGYTALGVRLPGHGTTVEDLATRQWEEWLATVDLAWRQLAGAHARIYGVGLSTGALLLLELARSRALSGAALLSPFLHLDSILAGVAHLIAPFFPYQRRRLPQSLAPYYYDRRPLRAIHQLHRLCRQTRRHLPTTRVPALVIGGGGDRTAPPGSACDFFRQLGSPEKELHLFGNDTPHVLTISGTPHAAEVFALVADFIAAREEALLHAAG